MRVAVSFGTREIARWWRTSRGLRSSFRAILNLVPGGPACSILLRRQAQRLSSLHDRGDTRHRRASSARSRSRSDRRPAARGAAGVRTYVSHSVPPNSGCFYGSHELQRFIPLTAVVFTAVMSSSALVAQTLRISTLRPNLHPRPPLRIRRSPPQRRRSRPGQARSGRRRRRSGPRIRQNGPIARSSRANRNSKVGRAGPLSTHV
jgi:hypothetical protein